METEAASGPEGIVGLLLRMRGHGISDPALLKVVEAVPHTHFVPVEFFGKAWQNRSLPISCGQSMHSPDITIRMISALRLESHHSVLEIGTGSGYQAGLIARLAKKVHSIDRYKTLLTRAQQKTAELEINNVVFAQADGTKGSGVQGIYDRIIVDSAYDAMPRGLLDELVSGGIVVTAIGQPGEEQSVVRLTKIGSRFEREDLFKVRFGRLETGIAETL